MAWIIPQHIPLPPDFLGFDPQSSQPQDLHTYHRHLPHWRAPGRCYFITFRLRDSIPAEVVAHMKKESQDWQNRLARAAATANGRLPPEEWVAWQKFQQIRLRKLEAVLDAGHGECLLRYPEHRQPLEEAFHHFDSIRCNLLAYAIMPNHAHVLCRPRDPHSVESLSRSWKRHSSDRIHRKLNRSGSLWQEESFDRIIRDADHYTQAVRYTAKNPLQAQLTSDEASVWLHPQILAANAYQS